MFPTPEVEMLAEECKRLGGKLSVTSHSVKELEELFGRFHQAPFTDEVVGLQWEIKTIFIPPGYSIVGTIIHEMGHVFACTKEPWSRDAEWDWLGWELAMAKKIGIEKYLIQNNYVIDFQFAGEYYSDLSDLIKAPEALAALCNDRLTAAKKSGLITEEELPLSVRTAREGSP